MEKRTRKEQNNVELNNATVGNITIKMYDDIFRPIKNAS